MFSHCLHPSSQALPSSASSSQLRLGITGHDQLTVNAQNNVDVALKNLVGDGAADTAQRWADHGKLLEKLAIIRSYLEKEEHDVVGKLLGTDRLSKSVSGEPSSDPPEWNIGDKGKGKETRYYARESQEDTDFDDSDDERGRTAHTLFASLAGIDAEDKENVWWFSSPPSSTAERDVDMSQELHNPGSIGKGEPIGNGAWRLNCLTPPESSPIRAPPSKSGLKSCSVTPRQSHLSGSVRNKVAAKSNIVSAVALRTPKPSRSITRCAGAMNGAGHSLSSPICLLSSSPVTPTKGRRQTPKQTKAFKSANTLIQEEITSKSGDHQIENIGSSSARPLEYIVLDASPKVSSKRKHPVTNECLSLVPDNSKKRRYATSTTDPRSRTTLHPISDVVASSSAVLSKDVMGSNPKTRIPSEEDLMPTEREKLALKRMDIAQQLANAYPHLVAPSYEKKRAKQLAKLAKERGRAATKRKLVQSPTVFSFETVDDDDGGMDWSRSRQLVDNLRDAVATGRRPVLPPLKCAQSPSPSP